MEYSRIHKVLFIDDEENVLVSLKRVCRKKSFHSEFCNNPIKALKLLRSNRYSIIVTDIKMPEMDGVEFLMHSQKIDPSPVRIVLTGSSDERMAKKAVSEGNLYKFLHKPIDSVKLLKVLDESIEFYEAKLRMQERLMNLGKFSTRILHDIKSPLAGIRSSAELIMDYGIEPKSAKDFCSIIIDKTDELVELAHEISDFASDSNFIQKDHVVDLNLKKFLHDWQKPLNAGINAKEIDIFVDVDEDCNLSILKIELDRIFNNLLQNAIDMPLTSAIKISVKKQEDEVLIKFLDNGGGVPDEIISKIFDLFFTNKKSHGTGLGLSNIKKIVENFNGNISVRNVDWEKGKGAQFEIFFPLKPAG